MPSRIREYTASTLKNAITNATSPFLVHFGTDWCAPCKRLERVLMELLGDWGDKVDVGKVNIEDEPDLARSFEVHRNPTVCVFCSGELVAKREGFANRLQLVDLLNSI